MRSVLSVQSATLEIIALNSLNDFIFSNIKNVLIYEIFGHLG